MSQPPKITDHVQQAVDRVLWQFDDSDRLIELIRALNLPIQTLEDAIYPLFDGRALDNAVGQQLDNLGQLIGIPREGRPDEEYRVLLQTEIFILGSQGRISDINQLIKLIYGEEAIFRIREEYPAELTVEIIEPKLTSPPLERVKRVLPAGVRLNLITNNNDTDRLFTFSDTEFLVSDPDKGFAPNPGGGGLWTPSSLTNAFAWFDGNDASTITESGGVISQWDDKSGNANHWTQGSAPLRPDYTGSINGVTVPKLNTNKFFTGPNINFSTHLMIAVVRPVSDVNENDFLGSSGTSNPNSFSLFRLGKLRSLSWVGGFAQLDSAASVTAGSSVLVGQGQQSNTFYSQLNGTQISTTGVTTSGSTVTLQNARPSIQKETDIAEVVVIDQAWTTDDRQRIEGYLAWKWGLEGSLPVGHPYKLEAPSLAGDDGSGGHLVSVRSG